MYSPSVDNEQPALEPEIGESDLTLNTAADEAGCSVKTLRRAIHKGELPKRYALGSKGAQLVVTRTDFEQWRTARGNVPTRGVSMDTPAVSKDDPMDRDMSTRQGHVSEGQMSTVFTLQAVIDQAVRGAVEPLVAELHDTRAELGDTREQLGAAHERVAHLEVQLAERQAPPVSGPLVVRLLRWMLIGVGSTGPRRR